MGLYSGGLIIERIFATEIHLGGLIFGRAYLFIYLFILFYYYYLFIFFVFFWGGAYYQNFTLHAEFHCHKPSDIPHPDSHSRHSTNTQLVMFTFLKKETR